MAKDLCGGRTNESILIPDRVELFRARTDLIVEKGKRHHELTPDHTEGIIARRHEE